MIEWPCNELKNKSFEPILCAFSSGGSIFDAGTWTVKILYMGQMVDNKDIDYIGPYYDTTTINDYSGWWKLFQGSSYVLKSRGSAKGPLQLKGFWPRKHVDPPGHSFVKEWKDLIDYNDRSFGKSIPSDD